MRNEHDYCNWGGASGYNPTWDGRCRYHPNVSILVQLKTSRTYETLLSYPM